MRSPFSCRDLKAEQGQPFHPHNPIGLSKLNLRAAIIEIIRYASQRGFLESPPRPEPSDLRGCIEKRPDGLPLRRESHADCA